MAEARARLRASSAYIIAHAGVLVGGAIQVSHGSWTARSRKSSRPWRVGACQRSRCANIGVRREARWEILMCRTTETENNICMQTLQDKTPKALQMNCNEKGVYEIYVTDCSTIDN